MEDKKELSEIEAFNIFIQVCNKFQGDRADHALINMAIDTFKKKFQQEEKSNG